MREFKRFRLYVDRPEEDAGRRSWRGGICMAAGDWKGSESDWDKDEEMKCSTCARLHCEKLSALLKGHVPSHWGWSLTPGGTISVVDARSQNKESVML